MLSFLIWFPIVIAFFLFLIPIQGPKLTRSIALLTMLILLITAFYVFCEVSSVNLGYAFTVQCPWVQNPGISYHLGVNHLGAMLILLVALVGLAAVWVSKTQENPRYFYGLALIMAGSLIGAFASLDLFFLYIFHEFALIPTFILIGFWGAEKRYQAAMKITLYLSVGSLILLVGLLGLYFKAGKATFDLLILKEQLAHSPIAANAQVWLFALLFFGFGILVSLFPFHTWAPIGYGEAPSLAAMLHAGVIKKFGLYGLMIIAVPLLPYGFEYWRPWIVWLAVGNLVYGGYVAMQQKDLRYMLAYSSVSHMGYAFLALAAGTPIATQGLILFLFAHGLSSAAGFGIVGYCRENTGVSTISELGGLARQMPFAATIFTMAALAACGLPGFANFPAELMIFFGSFHSYPWPTVLAVWTAVISAIYMLRAIRSVFLGPISEKWFFVGDVDYSRRGAFLLLLAVLLTVGFWPRFVVGQPVLNEPGKILKMYSLK